LRIWQKADRYTGRGQFTAYLLRITRNLCEDMRRRTPAIGLSEQERESACTLSAHAQAERNALQTAIEKAVHALPPFQRDVFILSHFENFTYAEIADILDCPPGTVASRKHQAVQNLRRALRDWFPGETEQTKEPTL
jgi:RNA polymerase sigma-70 factor (ECF subfamily)